MANELPLRGVPQSAPVQPVATPIAKTDANQGGPAFRALLDELEAKARELQDRSKSLDGPADLAGAARGAKATFDDALSIRDRLLEAYREARQQDGAEKRKI
jgi:hypothetical protein